jgi:hypothetical protein
VRDTDVEGVDPAPERKDGFWALVGAPVVDLDDTWFDEV